MSGGLNVKLYLTVTSNGQNLFLAFITSTQALSTPYGSFRIWEEVGMHFWVTLTDFKLFFEKKTCYSLALLPVASVLIPEGNDLN